MVEVCFLGTGGSVAIIDRDNTSFIINQDETLILIDCPGGVTQKIKKVGFDPRRISSLLVTHIHPDHIYGLPSLVHSLMLDECLIRLYGSAETVRFCQKLLDLFQLRDEKIKARIDLIALKANQEFDAADSLLCTSLEIPHSSSSLAFLFQFETEKKELIYSGDTPANHNLFQKAAGIDYLIHDCSAPSRFFEKYPSLYEMHTHSLDLGNLAQEAGVKCLIPCHFFGELDFLLSEVENEISQNFKGRLIIPKDFDKITL